MSASDATSPDQFKKRTTSKVDPAGEGAHLVTVEQFEGDKRTAARSYVLKKSSDLNPSARGGAYVNGWRITSGAGSYKPLHSTRKAAVAFAEDHFKNKYLGGR